MIGIPHRYLTEEFPGLGGVIKQSIEDFIVHEVPLYSACGTGEHSYFEIEKYDLSTLEALDRIASALGIPSRDIGYAGLKDRKAVSRQVLSIRLIAPEKILALRLSQIRILWVRLHTNKLRVGHLRGNRFRICVRGIGPENAADETIDRCVRKILEHGLPNFYGPQRFGSRGDGFRVGHSLLSGDWYKAVRQILGFPSSVEKNPRVVLARRRFMEEDLRGALEAFPRSYRVERQMLQYLRQSVGNYRGAIRRMKKSVKKIYFSAFQSYLFNRILDRRLELTGSLGKLFPGDLAYLHRNGAVFRVDGSDVEEQRARLFEISPSGPIFGKEMTWPGGLQGELERGELDSRGLRHEDFHQLMPGMRMSGGRRSMRVAVEELKWERAGSELFFEFFLPKGAYATTFLREIMKNDDPSPAFYFNAESEAENGVVEGS